MILGMPLLAALFAALEAKESAGGITLPDLSPRSPPLESSPPAYHRAKSQGQISPRSHTGFSSVHQDTSTPGTVRFLTDDDDKKKSRCARDTPTLCTVRIDIIYCIVCCSVLMLCYGIHMLCWDSESQVVDPVQH